MRAIIGTTVFPRRLTQLFADTKKSYENVVQTQHTGPEATSLHLRLRIQKDRLIAWGIQWSDRSSASQTGDIDGSLDRAGISDLVASIMCSIRELLDEAEALQSTQSMDISRPFMDAKVFGNAVEDRSWTESSLTRLEEILKDLTTSIDTLCDLSRPRIEVLKESELPEDKPAKRKVHHFYDFHPSNQAKPLRSDSSKSFATNFNPQSPRMDDLGGLAYIESSRLRLRGSDSGPSSSPPSYEAVATGADDRAFAYLSLAPRHISSRRVSSIEHSELPVLLDYGERCVGQLGHNIKPDLERFHELSSALSEILQDNTNSYSGLLRLEGWTVDVDKSRSAYVYEIPVLHRSLRANGDDLQPCSLLSFLQNGRDTDSNNIPSLENRFRLALNIASSVVLLQRNGVHHRNVSSSNIVFFVGGNFLSNNEKVWKGPIIRLPYLTAFHQKPSKDLLSSSDPFFSNIYQHPSLGDGQSSKYEFAHDLYSLGLILLEIGLWMPIGKFWKSKYTRRDLKARLQDIYLKKLSSKCGDGYMDVVLYCMTAADGIIPNASSSQTQQAFQENMNAQNSTSIIVPLERCCAIDNNHSIKISTSLPMKESIVPEHSQDQDHISNRYYTGKEVSPGNISESPGAFNGLQEVSNHGEVITEQKANQLTQSTKKIKVWSHELPSLYTAYWGSTMFPKLERILSRAISRWESYTVDLFMAGEDADTARPTVYMECMSTAKVRKILRHLNKELRLFEIKVVSGQIVRSKAGKKKHRKFAQKKSKATASNSTVKEHGTYQCDLNPHYQQKPVCGASIGAFRNGIHLPAVSFGGAVLINGEPYGMSVHHMLEAEDEMELGLEDANGMLRSIAPRPVTFSGRSGTIKQSDNFQGQYQGLYPFEVSEPPEATDSSSIGYELSEKSSVIDMLRSSPPEALYPFEISEDEFDMDSGMQEDDDFWLSADFESKPVSSKHYDDDAELGDTEGIQVGCGHDLIVTQPAIDDVDREFFPCETDIEEDHLSSHALGHIHASSGIKRSRRDEVIHEIDWALIKINEQRIEIRNIVQGGAQYFDLSSTETSANKAESQWDSYPSKVLRANDLGGLHVHASGRTSGLQTGMILPAMRMVRMPGRSFASHSWQVRGNFGGISLPPPLTLFLQNPC